MNKLKKIFIDCYNLSSLIGVTNVCADETSESSCTRKTTEEEPTVYNDEE